MSLSKICSRTNKIILPGTKTLSKLNNNLKIFSVIEFELRDEYALNKLSFVCQFYYRRLADRIAEIIFHIFYYYYYYYYPL